MQHEWGNLQKIMKKRTDRVACCTYTIARLYNYFEIFLHGCKLNNKCVKWGIKFQILGTLAKSENN